MDFFRMILGTARGSDDCANTKQSSVDQGILRQYPIFAVIAMFVMFLLVQSRVFVHGPCVEGEFEPNLFRQQVDVNGEPYCYVLYVPPGYDPNESYPLIVFLHGRGEAGFDGYAHTTVGIGTAVRNYPENFPCLVLMPQFPWDGNKEEWFASSDAAIADVQANYNVDPNRISLTGLSFGGENVWYYAAARPGIFSALMPIASSVTDAFNPADYTGVPIWVFHGAEDFVVPPEPMRAFVQEIEDAGGNIQYTEIPDFTHFIWNFVYADPNNINWLITQSRS